MATTFQTLAMNYPLLGPTGTGTGSRGEPSNSAPGEASTDVSSRDASDNGCGTGKIGPTAAMLSPSAPLVPVAVAVAGDASTAEPSSSSSPTRGLKKVPSLRRGAAAYSQLLQSAVMATIESSKEDGALSSSNSFQFETSSPSTAFDDVSEDCSRRRGQKHKRGSDGSDTAPRIPRRLQSRDGSSFGCDSDDIMDIS